MTAELLLSCAPGEIRAGLVEDGRIVELRVLRDGQASLVGGLFLGRVRQVAPALPGSFVELEPGRMAFLPGPPPEGGEGQAVLVQIVKDAFADKPPEVTRAWTLTGRLAVWTPFRPGVAISRRLAEPERARLAAVLAPLLAPGEGLTARTAAADMDAAILAAEIARLRVAAVALQTATNAAMAPTRIGPVPEPVQHFLATTLAGPATMRIDDRAAYASARQYPHFLPDDRVELDVMPDFAGRTGLAEAFDEALAREVPLDHGARLTIDATEAFTAIDVDLGGTAGDRRPASEGIRAVNLAAARAVARQLRLRAIGGPVVVDFISMAGRDGRDAVAAALAEATVSDPSGVQLLGWTRLGHYELTRRRGVTPLAEIMLEDAGPKRRKTPLTVGLEALRALAKSPVLPGPVRLRAPPAVAALFAGPLAAALADARHAAGRPVTVEADASLDAETFDIAPG